MQVVQNGCLFVGHCHRRPVLGALAASEAGPADAAHEAARPDEHVHPQRLVLVSESLAHALVYEGHLTIQRGDLLLEQSGGLGPALWPQLLPIEADKLGQVATGQLRAGLVLEPRRYGTEAEMGLVEGEQLRAKNPS